MTSNNLQSIWERKCVPNDTLFIKILLIKSLMRVSLKLLYSLIFLLISYLKYYFQNKKEIAEYTLYYNEKIRAHIV